MYQRTLNWIANDDWDTQHSVTEEFAIKTLKALYDEWPGGLEEINAAFRSQQSESRKKLEAAHQVIRDLCALTKELIQKK